MPEARQSSSKLAEMSASASSFSALVGIAVDVISVFLALLSFVESAPRAYRLKASNAAPPISTSVGTIQKRVIWRFAPEEAMGLEIGSKLDSFSVILGARCGLMTLHAD